MVYILNHTQLAFVLMCCMFPRQYIYYATPNPGYGLLNMLRNVINKSNICRDFFFLRKNSLFDAGLNLMWDIDLRL